MTCHVESFVGVLDLLTARKLVILLEGPFQSAAQTTAAAHLPASLTVEQRKMSSAAIVGYLAPSIHDEEQSGLCRLALRRPLVQSYSHLRIGVLTDVNLLIRLDAIPKPGLTLQLT